MGDQEVVRLGTRALLSRCPNFAVVAETANARECIAKVFEYRPDVVVLNVHEAGGQIDVCREITELVPETKVIIHSSLGRDDLLFEAIAAGAAGYILEQGPGDDLVRAIEAIGRGEALLDSALTQRLFARVREAKIKDDATVFAKLTDQELRVLAQVAEGRTNREIAQMLSLGEGTVRNYVSSILGKLHLTNRAEAAAYSIEHNLRDFLVQ